MAKSSSVSRYGRYLVMNRHGTGLVFRICVPGPLQPLIGRREIRRSLSHLTFKEAHLHAVKLGVSLSRVFTGLMARKSKSVHLVPLPDEIDHLDLIGVRVEPDGDLQVDRIHIDPENYQADIAALKEVLRSTRETAKAKPAAGLTRSYDEICAKFLDENMRAGVWTAKSKGEVESCLSRYGAHCATARLSPFEKASATLFKDALVDATLTTQTASKYLTRLTALFAWALGHEYVAANPFTGLQLPKAAKKTTARDERAAWSVNDIKRLLTTASPENDAREWIGLLALYTGARCGELAQLSLDNIERDAVSGIWYFDINANDDRRLKNLQSERFVPVHSRLIERGLLTYVQTLRASGATRVFPIWQPGRDGYAQPASRFFGRWRAMAGIDGDLHGCRHTVATALREAGVPVDVVADILGHGMAGETFGRYAKAASLPRLQAAIERLDY
jgi:integrase